MIQTALMVELLVVACLWYTGKPSVKARFAGSSPLLNGKVYAMLIAFALVLAFLWNQ